MQAMKKQSKTNANVNEHRLCIAVLAVYLASVTLFYILAGEQLKLRQSRGNIVLPEVQAGVVELVQGVTVEQMFTTKIQRLKQVGVQWSTSYRANSGTVMMELLDGRNGEMLMSTSFDAASVSEGMVLTMDAEEPLEEMYGVPLLLRLYSDSSAGSALTPLMNGKNVEGWMLSVNDTAMSGQLCMCVTGQDYIWTGLHYWELVLGGMVVLLAAIGFIWQEKKHGKRSYVINAMIAFKKYRFLIKQLVIRDFKIKYKRSVLGIFWSFLNPLLTMCVQYVVFSTVFKSDIPNYAVYLLIGIVMFNFFSEACGMSLTSILGNAGLITKVYIPKYIYPFTRVISSVINLSISLLPLIIVSLVTGVTFYKSALLAFFFLTCLILFTLGICLILSASMVFFRDTQFLWNVFSMMWMYATPIFYPESILPENMRGLLQFNPLYHFLNNSRMCILDGISPEPTAYVLCMLISLIMLSVGGIVFYKNQNKFILYL